MRKKHIVICDSNEVYARRLQDYFQEQKGLACSLEFYTQKEPFIKYISSQKPVACIVSEDWLEQNGFKEAVEQSTDVLLVLSEEECAEGNVICRYQSADSLIRKICESAQINVTSCHGKERIGPTKLIGIYTPIGRCLQTSFALVLGQMLAAKHKVLYLNFEAYSGFTQMMQRNFNADMADLLYFLKNLSQDFSQQFAGMKETVNGLDYIPPAFSYMDISQVLPGEWEHFLKTLGELGEYDYIILDLTDYVQGLYQILRNCSYVYTITRNEGIALAKLAHYENVLKELAYEDVLEKTKKCSFPVYRQLPMNVEDLLYSELADYARKILREDFNYDR
ncbi:MAG: hypothetical protein IJZ42_12700 [Lachnospiraceae bacterium]|nr:hypothetical protein [Lachnospiraceae bacterium]